MNIYDYLRKQGCSNVSIETYLRVLRAVLSALGVILPKIPKLNPVPRQWYLLSKEDLKYIMGITNLQFRALINFAAVTGLRITDICLLTVKDFMDATADYHDCSEVEDFLDCAPEGMMGFWELMPNKTKKLNVPCKVCNTPESSDLLLTTLNERVKYFQEKNEKEGLDLRISKNDPLFANRRMKFKGFHDPRSLSSNLGRYKHKLRAERERVFRYRYEQGEISRETYEESISVIPNFHAHALRKFFITTLARNRVDARISALMEGHRAPIATDSHYVNNDFLKESIKEEYMRCIPDLSFGNVEVRFLTSEERRSLEEKIEDLTEENMRMKHDMKSYVDKAVDERFKDAFDIWMDEKGF